PWTTLLSRPRWTATVAETTVPAHATPRRFAKGKRGEARDLWPDVARRVRLTKTSGKKKPRPRAPGQFSGGAVDDSARPGLRDHPPAFARAALLVSSTSIIRTTNRCWVFVNACNRRPCRAARGDRRRFGTRLSGAMPISDSTEVSNTAASLERSR